MEWRDSGILLSTRKHGETSAIVSLLTRDHGRHAGLVRGGAGRRMRGVLQAGNRMAASWRARLEDQLGAYTCELETAHAAEVLDDPMRLACLSAACALADTTLPERVPERAVYEELEKFLDALSGPGWQGRYVRWELGLLTELGFGLDLQSCAATGRTDQLAYVSPKSGRAVSRAAGAPYAAKMLILPRFLLDRGEGEPPGPRDLLDGLRLTGFFLKDHVLAPHGLKVPAARARFEDRVRAAAKADASTTD